jgi:hypothetical protein
MIQVTIDTIWNSVVLHAVTELELNAVINFFSRIINRMTASAAKDKAAVTFAAPSTGPYNN